MWTQRLSQQKRPQQAEDLSLGKFALNGAEDEILFFLQLVVRLPNYQPDPEKKMFLLEAADVLFSKIWCRKKKAATTAE